MSAPTLDVTIEPTESGAVVYGVLAAKTNADEPNGQLSLVLKITNGGPGPVTVSQIVVSFIAPPNVPPSSYAVNLPIALDGFVRWHFDSHFDSGGNLIANDNIFLPVPAPGSVKIEIFCATFSDPKTVTMPLKPYASTAIDGGYIFPARTDDLKDTEFWAGVSGTHLAAGDGSQLFAYDLGVLGIDPNLNVWSWGISNPDPQTNDDFRVWDKKIYAMAKGTVVAFKNDMPTNTTLGTQTPTPDPVEGNHFYIQHGPDLALYAHFQPNSLNSSFINGPNPDKTGAPVEQGDFLGIAGNSGNSSGPHLHIEVIRASAPWGGPPRPLPFRDMFVLDFNVAPSAPWPPTSAAPWSQVSAQDLPATFSMIWPGALAFNWNSILRFIGPLAWAWIIYIGSAIIITPGGQLCPGCTSPTVVALGVVSILLGVGGFAARAWMSRATTRPGAPRQLNVRADM
ncbi:MAG: M23 family metallopeptidase [Alphaproteobacteria bacterium]